MALTKLSRSVEGCVVLVTGAASGMGEATAKLFADQGAKVAAVDLNEAGLNRVVGEIEAAGCSVRGWTFTGRAPSGATRRGVTSPVMSTCPTATISP